MATVNNLIGDMKRKLQYPAQPQDGILAECLIETIDEKLTEINQTREAWFTERATITVSPGRDEYLLDARAPNLGKARFVWTQDRSDPNFFRRPVDIVPFEQLTTYYQGGDPTVTQSSANNVKHSAIACAVMYEVGFGNKIIFAPIPNQTADYVLIYEPMILRPSAKTDSGWRFDQFKGYLTDCASLRALPSCAWKGLSMEENAAQRREIAGGQGYGLVVDVARGDSLFRRWKWSQTNPQDNRTLGFGSGRR